MKTQSTIEDQVSCTSFLRMETNELNAKLCKTQTENCKLKKKNKDIYFKFKNKENYIAQLWSREVVTEEKIVKIW